MTTVRLNHTASESNQSGLSKNDWQQLEKKQQFPFILFPVSIHGRAHPESPPEDQEPAGGASTTVSAHFSVRRGGSSNTHMHRRGNWCPLRFVLTSPRVWNFCRPSQACEPPTGRDPLEYVSGHDPPLPAAYFHMLNEIMLFTQPNQILKPKQG